MDEAKILPKRKHKFLIKNSAPCLMDPFSFSKHAEFQPTLALDEVAESYEGKVKVR